jgi:hypothetical protein
MMLIQYGCDIGCSREERGVGTEAPLVAPTYEQFVTGQSEAILAARKTMVQGAVSLVQMALAQLADSDLVELDPERKATMVSNLMIVLSGDHSPTPVINTGTLYT